MNQARSCLLLILSLLAGCEGKWRMQNCTDGWAEVTCNYSNTDGTDQCAELISERPIKGKKVDSSTDHDPKNNSLTLDIKCKRSESHRCGSSSKSLHLFELSSCQTTFTQITSKPNKNNITCDFPMNKYKSWFFCKMKESRCEDILEPFQKSKPQFTYTDRGFNVSGLDAGVYWCGLRAQQGNQYAALRRVRVQELRDFSRSVTVGQNFSYFCLYDKDFSTIFICKGDDPETCVPVVSTDSPTNHKFSLKDEARTSNITVTVRDVRAEDAGTYWCEGRNPNRTHSQLFHRFQMSVTPPTTAASPQSHGRSQLVIIVSVCVAVMLLLCVFNFILFYKRLLLLKNSNTGPDAEQVIEDNVYEEIQDVNKPIMTIYATAGYSADPSDSLCEQSLDAEPKPGSAACDYSTVGFAQCPSSSSSTDGEPWMDPPDPTVDHPQQE